MSLCDDIYRKADGLRMLLRALETAKNAANFGPYAWIASINGLMPKMFIIRFKL